MIAAVAIPLGADEPNDTIDALIQAEAFVAGFEGDPTQTGVADILAGLRLAINREQAAPAMLAALEKILMPDVFHVAVNRVALSPERMRTIITDIYDIAQAAVAAAEGPQLEISAPSIAPTLEDLRADLSRAERALVCADMIDDYSRRAVEKASAQLLVDHIQQQITRIEESL